MGVAVSVSNPEKSSEEGGRQGHPGPGLSSQAAQDHVQGTMVLPLHPPPPGRFMGINPLSQGLLNLLRRYMQGLIPTWQPRTPRTYSVPGGLTAGEGRANTKLELLTFWLQRLCTLSFINCLHFLNVQLSNEITCTP